MKISKVNEIKLIFLFSLGLVIFISLLTFDPNDISLLTTSPNISKANIVGSAGAYLAWVLLLLMGKSSFVIPIFLVLSGLMFFFEEQTVKKAYVRAFGAVFLILAITSLFSLIGSGQDIHKFHNGGIFGLMFSDFLLKYLGTAGTLIVITLLFVLSLLITTNFLVLPFIGWLFKSFKSVAKGARLLPSGIAKAGSLLRKGVQKKEPFPSEVKIKTTVQPSKKEIAKEAVERIFKPKEAKSLKEKPEEAPMPEAKKPIVYQTPYQLPSLDLLSSPPPIEEREIKENLDENSRILEETLKDFDIEAKVVDVSKGPVITRYELEPARGVTINRITALSDNIALTMKAMSVRILAPVPGKGTVGVEVPNAKSTFVYLKEILEAEEYKKSDSKLKLAIGKDISGRPIVTDLDDMPHLLIAGTTGSGKTVCVNSIITALLFNTSPEELKFLMVDPKKVELVGFNDLPHLLAPVVTEAKKAAHALNWVVNEMERRLNIFTKISVRNIKAYKKKEESDNLEPLPYIIVIIDELADLMMVAQQEVEDLITRIAQLSRAAGIHMIIATQRPSVNVITGVIKANLPARISFKVPSMADSRTVLDVNGAEKLLGKGDLLFIEPGNPKIIRAQGALVSDESIARVTDFIKAQRKPEFVEEIIKNEHKTQFKKFEKDEVYDEAVKLVIQTKQASVSMLQRRLGVGYTRAARLVDMMEDEGIIGPYQGSKPRDILIDNIGVDSQT